jgi:hypothetical protein
MELFYIEVRRRASKHKQPRIAVHIIIIIIIIAAELGLQRKTVDRFLDTKPAG